MKSGMSGTVVMCDLQNIDPDCLDNGVNNTNCKTSQVSFGYIPHHRLNRVWVLELPCRRDPVVVVVFKIGQFLLFRLIY